MLLLRQDPVIDLKPQLMCNKPWPIPLADVPLPFSASTETYINLGALNLDYSVSILSNNLIMTKF